MNINQQRIALFEEDLRKAFDVQKLVIEDESHLHAGHAGAATGGGHFKLTIVAPQFQGLSPVARHRAIYAALNRHIPKEIHALTISALTPEEAGT
ncbi:BolA family transcriptional regulator [Polynucleobacter sp. AP-Titi-500A-B4]|uniref:BolA family protein n=1 Tax=Polynucleobacter sp. AP-Titi-500A-B4 TaxID=2576923 RepID=UPI001BFCFB06|nr:BolA family protein [Polynucleobacter sp. AP-Titi-500A-B4]QWE13456.1 BolA family transcriptional regulator [Polynucleobacter sp. AP-Titi-500A-B4]